MLGFAYEGNADCCRAYGLACMIDIWANGLSGVGPGFITGGGGSVFTATNIEAYQSMEDYHEFADPFFEVR